MYTREVILMEKQTLTIQSECDDLLLSVAMFVPDGEVKGIFQIAHGMAEHKERYEEFMKYLASQGYVTLIHDHRGHGASVKSEGDLGYFYDNRAEHIIEDLHQVARHAKSLYPNQPLTLFGHSMGALVVRKYIKKI